MCFVFGLFEKILFFFFLISWFEWCVLLFRMFENKANTLLSAIRFVENDWRTKRLPNCIYSTNESKLVCKDRCRFFSLFVFSIFRCCCCTPCVCVGSVFFFFVLWKEQNPWKLASFFVVLFHLFKKHAHILHCAHCSINVWVYLIRNNVSWCRKCNKMRVCHMCVPAVSALKLCTSHPHAAFRPFYSLLIRMSIHSWMGFLHILMHASLYCFCVFCCTADTKHQCTRTHNRSLTHTQSIAITSDFQWNISENENALNKTCQPPWTQQWHTFVFKWVFNARFSILLFKHFPFFSFCGNDFSLVVHLNGQRHMYRAFN